MKFTQDSDYPLSKVANNDHSTLSSVIMLLLSLVNSSLIQSMGLTGDWYVNKINSLMAIIYSESDRNWQWIFFIVPREEANWPEIRIAVQHELFPNSHYLSLSGIYSFTLDWFFPSTLKTIILFTNFFPDSSDYKTSLSRLYTITLIYFWQNFLFTISIIKIPFSMILYLRVKFIWAKLGYQRSIQSLEVRLSALGTELNLSCHVLIGLPG